jgi:type IV pilus assembly protein PilW
MVSITVGLILLSGVVSIFVSNKTAYRLQESTNVLDENARYALNQIQYHLRMGDHWGGVEADFIDVAPALGLLPISTTCTQSPVVSTVGFFALEGGASSPLSCIPAADYVPNTDVLVVRYADPERTATAALVATNIYLRAKVGAAGQLFLGNGLGSLPGDLYEVPEPETQANYAFRTVIYYIRRCASQDRGTAGVCDAADDTTPTLARLVLNGTGLVREDVVAGVEQMQATFGVLTDGAIPTTQYFDAATITANNQWPSVVNVQVSLMVRGPDRDVAFSDPRDDYAMYGGYTYAPAAADLQFHRKQFNFAVQVRNKTRG